MQENQFNQFVWEEEAKVLGLPHFFLGKFHCPKFVLTYYIPAFIFLGIGSLMSFIVFILEKACVNKIFKS